ncbi:hypothetical protein ACLQ2Q_02715 [Microbacterium sp. DT81.1]|uniref:hypothetical protein n=1 Tax=Microbacterium sp. DT81.1 TaxID=3393413 RepID=UPI003CEB3636
MSAPATPDDSIEHENSAAITDLRDVDLARGGEAELVSRLRVIEAQPLGARAAAYASVHEELAKRLESAPSDERA